ncbi:DUF1971 domain-containing protein [Shigella sonnei]|uniref:DUF1971 domain-containing protein n=1 Tax=Shigella sonnei TaxID=624 RepID=UPI004046FA2A
MVSVVTLVWGISPRQPSGKNIIRWLLKKRTNGSVRYCQYTSHSAEPDQVILIEAGQFEVFPPEKWHNIEAMTDDTYFNIDFFVAPEVLMEGAQQRKVIHNGK